MLCKQQGRPKPPPARIKALSSAKAYHSASSYVQTVRPSTSVVDVGSHNQSKNACLPTSQMDPHQALGRRGRRFGSFRESVPLLGGLGHALGYCPWQVHDVQCVAQRVVPGKGSRKRIAVVRQLGRGFVRSLRIRFRASTRMLVGRRTPDLYSRD